MWKWKFGGGEISLQIISNQKQFQNLRLHDGIKMNFTRNRVKTTKKQHTVKTTTRNHCILSTFGIQKKAIHPSVP